MIPSFRIVSFHDKRYNINDESWEHNSVLLCPIFFKIIHYGMDWYIGKPCY